MSRYDHALNREPPEDKIRVQKFGFDNASDDLLKLKKKFRYFRLQDGAEAKIGFVITDPQKMFAGAFVHWYEKYFLCNSTKEHKSFCCQRLESRIYRTACIIIKYGENTNEVMPWCFGKRVFERLMEINEAYPLDSYDFIVKRRGGRFPIYDFQYLRKAKLLSESSQNKEVILTQAKIFQDDIDNILGQKLSSEEIKELITKK